MMALFKRKKKEEIKKEKLTIKLILKDLNRYKWLYLFFALPVVLYYVVFRYIPIYGIQIAFRDYKLTQGIWNSPFVGFKHFFEFFDSIYLGRLLRNTLRISIIELLIEFPAPIIFALLLNEITHTKFKKTIQTITYLPHFISTVVICGLLVNFAAADGGLFNIIIDFFGGVKSDLLMRNDTFLPIYIGSNIWTNFGWGSIIYIAALSGVDQNQYEAAYIDGAGRFQRMRYVTIPGIAPIIVIQLILKIGGMLSVGGGKLLLLYSPLTYEVADVVSTFVYRKGLLDYNYSFSTAVDLLNSVINLGMITMANKISRRVNETSLW